MAAGKPDVIVEIEFESGVWTDVTDRVLDAGAITIQKGRSSNVDTIQPGLCSFTLDNNDGVFTPDSPVSPYYPNVVEGRWVRVTVEKGATSSVRFSGPITSLVPTFPAAASESTVEVTATDVLGVLERRVLRPLVWEYGAANLAAYFPLTEPEGSARALAAGGRTPGWFEVPIRFMEPRGSGVVDFGKATGIGLDGASAVTLNPAAYLAGSGRVSANTLGFFFSASEGAAGTVLYADLGGNGDGTLTLSLNTDGYLRVRRVDGDGTAIFDGATAYGPKVADGGVHFIRWRETEGTSGSPTRYFYLYVNEVEVATTSAGGWVDIYGRSFRLGAPTTGTFSYSHFGIGGYGGTVYNLGRATGSLTQDDLIDYLTTWTRQTITTTATDRHVVPFASDGLSALEVVQRIANNEAGIIVTDDATGETQIPAADECYPATVGITIDVEDDAVGTLEWARGVANVVRYVTASNGLAEVTVADDDAATEGTAGVDACTANVTELEGVASRRLAAGKYQRLRPARVVLDLATATNDLYADALGAGLSTRVKLTGLPTSHFGVTEIDAHVEGWVEEIDAAGYRIAYDLSTAQSTAAGVFDTGRFGWEPGTCTASAIDDNDTSVTLTWTDGSTLSTDSGDYPLDLDLNGERVRISSAPGAGTSPRTVTISRGIAPTVARAHSAGEPVQVWDVDRFR